MAIIMTKHEIRLSIWVVAVIVAFLVDHFAKH